MRRQFQGNTIQHSRLFNVHHTCIPDCWVPSDRATQLCQYKLRLPFVYRYEYTQRSKQSLESTYYGSYIHILIVYLYSQYTDVVLLGLRVEIQLDTSFTAFLPSSELYLLHWLDLQKEQNSPLKLSRAVKSYCAHHYVLDGATLPMWKTFDGTI